MDLSALQALLERAPGVTVACVGDLMLDRFVYGEVSRVSPEAPVPVLRAVSETSMLGAVGNVARNLAALGAKARVIAAVGDDAAGEEVADLLQAEPGITASLDVIEGGRTIR